MRYAHLYRVANLCGDALRVVIHPNRSKMLHEVPRVPETRIQKLQSLRRDDYKVVLTLVANAVRGGRGRDDLSPKDAFAAALATIYVGLDLRRIDL